MKIRLFSDLHLEFSDLKFDHIWTPSEEDKDQILLLAGDIGKGTQARRFIEPLCENFKHVLYIFGNHEFWDQPDFHGQIETWRRYEDVEGPPNFHFLHNDWRILDGVRFLGGTMWTDYNGGDYVAVNRAHRIMNDFAFIIADGKRIDPNFIIKQHDEFIDFLLKKWDEPFEGKTVVMTHHSPGNELRRRGNRSDAVGAAYFADLEQMIGYHNKVDLWVHGHTHRCWDYMINETRVVCNPYGYYENGTNPDFDSKLVIEI